MKKALQFSLGVFAIAASLNFQSCSKIEESVVPAQDVSFTGASADIIIPATSDTTDQLTMGQIGFSYNLDSMIKAQTSGIMGYSNINTVMITSLTLTLEDADADNNFANFSYAAASFNTGAVDANNNHYDEYTVAVIPDNPDSYNEFINPSITDSAQDVKKYFSPNTTFTYSLVGKLRRPTTKPLTCHVDIAYNINVKP